MNDPSQMMNRNYGMWQPTNPPPVQQKTAPPAGEDQMSAAAFQNPGRPVFQPGVGGKRGRMNWKGKKAAEKRMMTMMGGTAPSGVPGAGAGAGSSGTVGGGYMPPALHELQHQNRVKARRFYSKKKSQQQQQQHVGGGRFAPYAPRNTTSFIIRAKKAGGIASLVSPCPVTPAVLPTPRFSPSRERLVDMAKEEWGVDGYGSMKGLIRLRSPTSSHGVGGAGDDDEDVEDGSSESDVEEHVEVERRLDHDLSRFEMVNFLEDGGGMGGGVFAAAAGPSYLLENRVDDQDAHIAQLEEENLTLKERLFLMEREMDDMRRRLQVLEADCFRGREVNRDNATEEVSDNENEEGGDVCSEKSAGD